MMFAFRVATQVGIGHVMRMKWLALELQNQGCRSIFILDHQSEAVLPFLAEIESDVFCLNETYQSDEEDALHTLKYLQDFPHIGTVILDSYTLGISWEKTLKKANKKVIVFDDLAREHQCDMLFDAKWLGTKTSLRYHGKLPEKCFTFLGPQFAILSPAYQCTKNKSTFVEGSRKKVLLSLGGGGDLNILAKLITKVYQQFSLQDNPEIFVVIGPKAENITQIEFLAKQNAHVTLLYQPKCLAKYYRQADLFVGALGTSLYELAATKTPAITFSIADNQQNNDNNLADLGHYFHLASFNAEDTQQVEHFSRLIVSMLEQLPRVRALRELPVIEVDGAGAANIADILLSTAYQHLPLAQTAVIEGKRECNGENEKFILNDSSYLRKVNDKDVNHYRQSRNLPNNSKRMTIQTEIESLEHYMWWLNNERQSYVLYQNNQPLLYIWHQVFLVNEKQYLYGGWFTAQGEVPFNVAMLALKWQLEYTKKVFPQGHWLAVINKKNKFVNLLNKYMGFSAIPKAHDSFQITQNIFSQALPADFNFVELNFDENG
jgi:UDP-2,4-diacetamido-2,4,6-trideoxy-beta-L-altropyranose hydrolase